LPKARSRSVGPNSRESASRLQSTRHPVQCVRAR